MAQPARVLYVMIGRETFSAAMTNAVNLKQMTEASFVQMSIDKADGRLLTRRNQALQARIFFGYGADLRFRSRQYLQLL